MTHTNHMMKHGGRIDPFRIGLFTLSILSSAFLLFTYLNYSLFKLDASVLGVLHELFTLPSIVCQPVLFVLAFLKLKSKNSGYDKMMIATLILSALTLLILCMSFLLR